jgi:hypothetical protein
MRLMNVFFYKAHVSAHNEHRKHGGFVAPLLVRHNTKATAEVYRRILPANTETTQGTQSHSIHVFRFVHLPKKLLISVSASLTLHHLAHVSHKIVSGLCDSIANSYNNVI